MLRSLNVSRPVKDDLNLNHPNLDDIDLQKNLSVTMRSSIEFMAQHFCFAFGFGNVAKSANQLVDVTIRQHLQQIFSNQLVTIEHGNHINGEQFFSHNLNLLVSKITLTHPNHAAILCQPRHNVGLGCGSPFLQGDNTPHSLAVFFCPSFFVRSIKLWRELIHIMMGLFGHPSRMVVPVSDISTPSNSVANTVESIGVGYPIFITGITA